MFTTVTAAAISFRPQKLNMAANADRLEADVREAAKRGAQLAVSPEGALDGYAVNEVYAGTIPAADMRTATVTPKSAVIGRFRALAKELNICLAVGCAEAVDDDIYNCVMFIDHKGKLCGRYHKMQFAEGLHPDWWFNRIGKTSRAIDTPFGRAGFMICNDRWNPELARIAVLDGAQYLMIPSFGSRSRAQDATVLARARENGVPIVEANVGVTMIISKGEIVARSRRVNAITIADIHIPALPSARNRDAQEQAFLKWRAAEMPKRLKVSQKRYGSKRPGLD